MIRFLLKGLLRDRSRSLFPVLMVTAGVMITVAGQAYFKGVLGSMVQTNANFQTGYVKIMSRAYARLAAETPNDLALVGVDSLLTDLRRSYPIWSWTPRIHFGGLLDIPDKKGETRSQGPAMGLAVDLLNPASGEMQRLNVRESLVRGRLPRNSDEILISDKLAGKLDVEPGEVATLISSTMNGSMAIYNFTISGTVQFGIQALDKGAILADIRGIRSALDMDDAAGEIVGYQDDKMYLDETAQTLTDNFNGRFSSDADVYAPSMTTLANQNGLRFMLEISDKFSGILVSIFIAVMSLVLWNSGLMGSLRRYGEIGVRLAIGESQGHIYRSLLAESVIIGVIGSIIGSAIGIIFSYWLQAHGLNIGSMLKGSTLVMTGVLRSQVTITTYYIGFIPGVLATLIGTAFAGVGIYRRSTAQLFKELEV